MIYWFAYCLTLILVCSFGPALVQLGHSLAASITIGLGMAATFIIGKAKEQAENE